MSLKVFSHAAYNISRVQTADLADIKQLFAHPMIHLEKAKPEDVTSKLHFRLGELAADGARGAVEASGCRMYTLSSR